MWAATISPRLTRVSACSSRSLSSTRLGSPVSVSCSAMCAILASERRCSVMSWWVVDGAAVGHRLHRDGDAAAVAQAGCRNGRNCRPSRSSADMASTMSCRRFLATPSRWRSGAR